MAHKPTDANRAQVEALIAYGIPQSSIAEYMGIDPKTLRLHYRAQIDGAVVKAHAAVGKFLYNAATGAAMANGATMRDCLTAAMFYAKTQMGWREVQQVEQTTTHQMSDSLADRLTGGSKR